METMISQIQRMLIRQTREWYTLEEIEKMVSEKKQLTGYDATYIYKFTLEFGTLLIRLTNDRKDVEYAKYKPFDKRYKTVEVRND